MRLLFNGGGMSLLIWEVDLSPRFINLLMVVHTWNKTAQGLPATDIGRIALAISPVDPEVIYAMVEAAMGKGGFFRSTNRGGSWEKMSDYAASGNYYVELVPDPVNKDRIYSMDTWMQVSNNGGALMGQCR